MRRFAPLLTLLAVAVLGGALLTLDVLGNPANQTAQPTPAELDLLWGTYAATTIL